MILNRWAGVHRLDAAGAGLRAGRRGGSGRDHLGKERFPGTGRQVEFRASDFHRLGNGRITRTWHLEDYFGIATQLGLTFSR